MLKRAFILFLCCAKVRFAKYTFLLLSNKRYVVKGVRTSVTLGTVSRKSVLGMYIEELSLTLLRMSLCYPQGCPYPTLKTIVIPYEKCGRYVFQQSITPLSGSHLGKRDARTCSGLLCSLGMLPMAVRYLKKNDYSAMAGRVN